MIRSQVEVAEGERTQEGFSCPLTGTKAWIATGIKHIENIPKLITVDLKDMITKDLPAVLMPVAITITEGIMPKEKHI